MMEMGGNLVFQLAPNGGFVKLELIRQQIIANTKHQLVFIQNIIAVFNS